MNRLYDEFLYSGKTYAQVSLERTVRSEARSGRDQLQNLGAELLGELRQSSSALPTFKKELEYQFNNLAAEFTSLGDIQQDGFNSVVRSIEHAAGAIGANLTEIRWAIERHTAIATSPRATEAHELVFRQGISCYEVGDYSDAITCFEEALRLDRTNYIASQYLGMIAVIQGDHETASSSFERAIRYSKHARKNHDEAMARSHLAHLRVVQDRLSEAATEAEESSRLQPKNARFGYEHARLRARLGQTVQAIDELRRAIEINEKYWTAPLLDPSFEVCRVDVEILLNTLKEERRRDAATALQHTRAIIDSKIPALYRDASFNTVRAFERLLEKFLSASFFDFPSVVEGAIQLRGEIERLR